MTNQERTGHRTLTSKEEIEKLLKQEIPDQSSINLAIIFLFDDFPGKALVYERTPEKFGMEIMYEEYSDKLRDRYERSRDEFGLDEFSIYTLKLETRKGFVNIFRKTMKETLEREDFNTSFLLDFLQDFEHIEF